MSCAIWYDNFLYEMQEKHNNIPLLLNRIHILEHQIHYSFDSFRTLQHFSYEIGDPLQHAKLQFNSSSKEVAYLVIDNKKIVTSSRRLMGEN